MEWLAPPFEPGFDRVVQLDFPGVIEGSAAIRVGLRPGRVRVETPTDQAWEFDDAGRLVVAQERSRILHVTLDGRVWGHRVFGTGSARRLRPDPGPDDASAWHARIHRRIRRWSTTPALAKWVRGEAGPALEFCTGALGPAAGRDETVLKEEVERARRIWRRIPVLPPDQYEALVVQISEGCPWDRCRFCTLYREVPYRARPIDEIARHLDEILDFLGPSVTRFHRVFLGQANALLRDTGELLEIFDCVRERVRIEEASRLRGAPTDAEPPSVDGLYAFVDAFHRPRPAAEWRRLRNGGLRRVYVGLESGDAARLEKLGKPLDPERAIEQVRDLHDGGLPVGLILLAGLGRADAEARHREASARVLRRMDLGVGDQVYLSPLVHPAGGEMLADLPPEDERVPALNAYAEMRDALRAAIGRGVPIAPYDLKRLSVRTPRG